MKDIIIEQLKQLSFWKNHKLEWLPTTTSTNDDLKKIWRDKNFSHIIEVTDVQTKGKGQYDRKWASDNIGQCLMFSFTVDVKEYSFPISMIAGISLAKALDNLGIDKNCLWLKWPNDIWLNNKKLAGILTESTTFEKGFRCIVGIGINILPLSDKNINATSLKEFGLDVTREKLLIEFCNYWDKLFKLSSTEQASIWNDYSNQFKERKYKIKIPNVPEFEGRPKIIKNDGTLIVLTDDKKEIEIISATLLPII